MLDSIFEATPFGRTRFQIFLPAATEKYNLFYLFVKIEYS